jgi:diguanylate cyclase (GGDEF)-like protein
VTDVTVTQPEVALVTSATSASDLLSLHESIAGLLATQGDYRRAYQHLRAALDLSRAGSLRDSLTAGYNRRYLDQRLHGLLAERCGPAGIAIALIDLDLFKQVNDTFGHVVGDNVLRRVAYLLQEGLPSGGFSARYGGEEFALVLPDVDAGTAIRIAEDARARVAHHPWSNVRPGLRVTISVGLVHETKHRAGRAREAERQLVQADKLLYAAKRAGRNLVAYRDRESIQIVEHPQ